MPIPQLKKAQNWRNNNKKYYLKRSSNNNFFKKRKKPGDEKSFWDKIKFKLFIFLGVFFVLGLMFSFSVFLWLSNNLPDPNKLQDREIAQSTKIFDRTGKELLYEIHGNEERTLVALEEIPDHVEWAVIAMEDKNFYNHSGFSLWAITRSAFRMVFQGGKGSGSTLTQQFTKNSILTNERTIIRKIKELLLARKIEKTYSKNEILQMYLNEIPYGGAAYGVEAASKKYFGKNVQEINIAEAALLAAIIQAPTRYSPYGSNKDLLIGRQQYIIDLMEEQGYITEAQANAAKQYELNFKKPGTNIKAPHFVMYIKEILSEKYGEKLVEQGGLKIYTTLDLYKQEIAERIIREQGEKNNENYEANNASLLSIDPKNGQILAMVGSRDYFNNEIDGQVNITTSIRQPGSSLKPLVYASSFIKGFNPNSLFYDVLTNFSNDKNEPYEPNNYDSKEHGLVSIRKALAGSLNIPAVKALYVSGVDNVLSLAEDLNYSTFGDKNRFGLSLVLGGGEVKMIEHVNAYSAFAREGLLNEVSGILKVEDSSGEILEEFEKKEKKVLDSKIARMINDILSDNTARAYAFGENNWLNLGNRPVAAKTGTTNDYRDAWTIGYTPSIVTGVWVGNNDNTEMKRGAAGGVVAAPIWNKFMDEILGDTPVEEFKKDEIKKTGIAVIDGDLKMEKTVKIDSISGLLATDQTPEELIEEKTFFEAHSILYYIDKKDPLKKQENYKSNDPQYELWEEGVRQWVEREDLSTSSPPTEFDNIHKEENKPEVSFIQPKNNENIINENFEILIRAESKNTKISFAEYFINNNPLAKSYNYPYGLSAKFNFLNNGFHNLSVKVCDEYLNCSYTSVDFNLILENKTEIKDVFISVLDPLNGSAISNMDFPLNIDFRVDNFEAVASVECYYLNKEGNSVIFDSLDLIDKNQNTCIWSEIPASGNYDIKIKTKNWNGKTIKNNGVLLIINNTNKEELEEENVKEE